MKPEHKIHAKPRAMSYAVDSMVHSSFIRRTDDSEHLTKYVGEGRSLYLRRDKGKPWIAILVPTPKDARELQDSRMPPALSEPLSYDDVLEIAKIPPRRGRRGQPEGEGRRAADIDSALKWVIPSRVEQWEGYKVRVFPQPCGDEIAVYEKEGLAWVSLWDFEASDLGHDVLQWSFEHLNILFEKPRK